MLNTMEDLLKLKGHRLTAVTRSGMRTPVVCLAGLNEKEVGEVMRAAWAENPLAGGIRTIADLEECDILVLSPGWDPLPVGDPLFEAIRAAAAQL